MAQLPPVSLPEKTWVNVYSETGITSGKKVVIQNIGSYETLLVDSVTKPDLKTTGYNILTTRDNPNSFFESSPAPDGVWAYSELGTTIQVEEA